MTVALDLGCHEFRSLRWEEKSLHARRIPSVYTVLDDSPGPRRFLDQVGIPYVPTARGLVTIGEAALDLVELVHSPLVPVLLDNQIPQDDPVGRQVCATLVDILLPAPRQADETCMMVLPGNPTGPHHAHEPAAGFLTRLLRLKGYRPQILHGSTALILAEMSAHQYTGIGISIGAGSVACSATYRGIPVIERTLDIGTRRLEEQLSEENAQYVWDHHGERYLDIVTQQMLLKDPQFSLISPRDAAERKACEHYGIFLDSIFEELGDLLAAEPRLRRLPTPLPLICSGGSTLLAGFRELVLKQVHRATWPIAISDVLLSRHYPYDAVRGAFVQGLVGESADVERKAA